MNIKSLEELRKIREKSTKKINLRHQGQKGDITEILIGMATCGIASGARQTLNAITSEIVKKNVQNIKVIPVGCLGYCHSEPIIQVNIPDRKPIIYGKVNEEKAREIINTHIIGGKIVDKYVLDVDFEKA